MKFDVPLGECGDNYDRFVRMEEMEQSMRIIEQALSQIPQGAVQIDYSGREIPAEVMVDMAKMDVAQFCQAQVKPEPTLEGSTRKFQASIASQEKRSTLPAKEDTYGNIEGLMRHFKLVMMGHGIRTRQKEKCMFLSRRQRRAGFYVVSDGSDRPYRVRVRPPCFTIMGQLPELIVGGMVADIVPTFGSINMIGGELDR